MQCNLSAIWYFDTEKPDNANTARGMFTRKIFVNAKKAFLSIQLNYDQFRRYLSLIVGPLPSLALAFLVLHTQLNW